MKKYFLPVLVFFLFTLLETQAQTGYGFKAGINLAKMKFDTPDSTINTKMVGRYHFGAIVDIKVTPEFYIQPQLLVSRKGTRIDLSSTGFGSLFTIKTTMSPTYVEFPVNLVYKIKFDYGRIIIGAGPYLAYGIGGKIKVNIDYAGLSQDTTYKISWGNSKDSNDMVPLDYGLSFTAGYEINNFMFTLNYSRGLASMIPENDEKIESRNRVVSLSAAYVFRKKSKSTKAK